MCESIDPTSSNSIYSDYDPTTSEGLVNIAGAIGTGGQSVAVDALGGPSVNEAIDEVGRGIDDKLLGGDAADAAKEAAATQAAAQQAGLDYLMETEAVPQAFRQAGLQQLGSVYGFGFDPETGQATYTGDMSAQQGLIDQAQMSPLYAAIMGTQDAGEQAIARSAMASGGLRGGATAANLAGFGQDLENQALLESYNQQLGGIQGLAGLPSQAGQISQQFGQIGQTQAQGNIAAAQAKQDAFNNILNMSTKIGAAAISDVRLKTNIKYIGPTAHPEVHNYEWDWKEESGKEGHETGYLAQEVEETYPEFVIEGNDGYKRILKDKLEAKLKDLGE